MDSRLLVSIILSGQLSLKYKLLSSDLEDVRQRMTHCTELRLLTKDETSQYLNHRITIAGGKKNMFEPQAIEAFYELSKGNMRALDKIARASFEKAFNDNREAVTAGDVAAVRSELLM